MDITGLPRVIQIFGTGGRLIGFIILNRTGYIYIMDILGRRGFLSGLTVSFLGLIRGELLGLKAHLVENRTPGNATKDTKY